MLHVLSPPGGCQHGGTGCPGQAALRRGTEQGDKAGGIAKKPQKEPPGVSAQRRIQPRPPSHCPLLSLRPFGRSRSAQGGLITLIKCTAASLGRMRFALEWRRLKPRPGGREDGAGAAHGAATSSGPGCANVTLLWCLSRVPKSPGSWHRGVPPWHGHGEAATVRTGTNGAQKTTVALPPPCSGTLLCLVLGFSQPPGHKNTKLGCSSGRRLPGRAGTSHVPMWDGTGRGTWLLGTPGTRTPRRPDPLWALSGAACAGGW